MSAWIRPIDGWVARGEVPGPDVDEFADPAQVAEVLGRPGAPSNTLLAVQHPHRTPSARAAGLTVSEALPLARKVLAQLRRSAYRPVREVVALYQVDGPDGSALGLLCLVDPAAVGADGLTHVRHSEQVYPEVVAERAAVLSGLGCATSAAMLVPVSGERRLTDMLRQAISASDGASGDGPDVSTVDSHGRRHRIWLVDPGPMQDSVLAAAGAAPLMVVDGNHRVAAATEAGPGGLLAVITAGPGLRIGAFHRALCGTGLIADDLVSAWRAVGLTVRETPEAGPPSVPGTVVADCRGRTLTVELPPVDPRDPVPRIDHGVVENLLLHKALGIDPEGGRVRPVPEGRVPGPEVDVLLLVAPVPLADVQAVHAAGRRMPRKSTYFTPKPRSGLLLADLT